MTPIQIEYAKFLLQHNFADLTNFRVDVLIDFYKRDLYETKDFLRPEISINIENFYQKVLSSRTKDGLFLTKINDSNFIKLMDFFLSFNMSYESYKRLYKAVLEIRNLLYSSIRLYDIKKNTKHNLYDGIIVENFGGNYIFSTIPLEKILFCYNTTRYWLE